MKKLTILLQFFSAVLVAFIAASLLHTQMVLVELTKIDVVIPLPDRLYMSWQDIVGLLPSYGLVVLIGLAIAFLVAKLIRKYSPIKTRYLYALAGGIAMLCILLAMHPILNLTLLASARSTLGIALQVMAGILGGLVFAHLRKQDSKLIPQ